jgi:hypothetical protein
MAQGQRPQWSTLLCKRHSTAHTSFGWKKSPTSSTAPPPNRTKANSAARRILVGTIVADLGIQYVFAAFATVALAGGIVTLLFALETKGRVLEELSP